MELTVEQALAKGVAAHKEGNLRDAEQFYLALLRRQPAHPEANHNLGMLNLAEGRTEAALPFFKSAVAANTKNQEFWLAYIECLIRMKSFDAAKHAVVNSSQADLTSEKINALNNKIELAERRYLKTRPGATASHTWRASDKKEQSELAGTPSQQQCSALLAVYRSGPPNKAKELATLMTKQYPEHGLGWKVLGSLFFQTGQLNDAAAAYKKAESLSPNDAEPLINLGMILHQLGNVSEAEACYRRAIRLNPSRGEAHSNLGNLLQEAGRLSEAEISHRRAITVRPEFEVGHFNLGNALQDLGRLAEAEQSLRQAIRLKPSFAEAHIALGSTLQQLGKLAEAKASYGEALELRPRFAEAHRKLCKLKKFVSRDEQYASMRKIFCDKDTPKDDLCRINFALAKANEDLADYEQAFRHYTQGNAILKELLQYDIRSDAALFNEVKANHHLIADCGSKISRPARTLEPLFIVGMPRSGTTLVEQIISTHPSVTGAGELNFVSELGESIARGRIDPSESTLMNFRAEYLSRLDLHAKGNHVVTDKMPMNFLYLGLITAAFPDAKIVHVKRDAAATCWANYKQYFDKRGLGFSSDIHDVVKYYQLYEDLMHFWTTALPQRIYTLDYESLTERQDVETRQLIDHLNLQWDDRCLAPETNERSVATNSNIQIRQRVYTGSSNQWKRYRPFLHGSLDDL